MFLYILKRILGFWINNTIKNKFKKMQKTSIKRLYEADDIQQPAPMQHAPDIQMPPAQEAPVHVVTNIEEIPSFDQVQAQQEQPQDQNLLPQSDVMTLTVQELMDRCQQVNPLVCMGLQQFIDSNRDQLLAIPSGGTPEETPNDAPIDGEEDINFSKQMEPKAPEFSLDQPVDDLQFPQE
jgi:hypothetical protein